MRFLQSFTRSLLAIALAGIAAKANAQSIDELYEAARKEGALSLNGGGPAASTSRGFRNLSSAFLASRRS